MAHIRHLHSDVASLPKKERNIVNGLSNVFIKNRGLGDIRLVELVRLAWAKKSGYVPRKEKPRIIRNKSNI
jgi:hypothetical protein